MSAKPPGRTRPTFTDQEALQFHSVGRPGKLEVVATKPMATQRDLSLAYSPGVAVPVLAIAEDPSRAYDYTVKGNFVAVITNGTAILGLGNRGALAAKPVMEGKAVLFKRFADIDSIDLEVSSEDPDEIINCVKLLGAGWGGINLEDIKAPECFVIEQRLRELMDIPVFHDDQHGTAIIAAAGLINALHLTGREIADTKLVCNGAGAAGIACLELLQAIGFRPENLILCDTKGVIYQGRTEGMNQWKSALRGQDQGAHAGRGLRRRRRRLRPVGQGRLHARRWSSRWPTSRSSSPWPIRTRKSRRRKWREVRDDAIMATGRSDYPNQINNVLGFPYIFRGALDVRASAINMEMKIAAAHALAELAREDVPDEVAVGLRRAAEIRARLHHPGAVRSAADLLRAAGGGQGRHGHRRRAQADRRHGRLPRAAALAARSDRRHSGAGVQPAAPLAQARGLRRGRGGAGDPRGGELRAVRASAARCWSAARTACARPRARPASSSARASRSSMPRLSTRNSVYTNYLYERLQRHGYLLRDCQRLVNTDRNHFAACMVALGDADAMVTGVTRNFSVALEDVRRVIDPKPGHRVIGVSLVVARGRTVLVADTAVTEMPNAEELAEIAIEAAGVARRLGYEPRLAMLAFSTFGHPEGERSARVIEAVKILDGKRVDFEYDGEMAADVALNAELMAPYPFCRLSGPANVLVMPAFHSASISTKMLQELGGATVIGPLLVGLDRPVQIVQLGAKDNQLVNMAALAAYNISG